MEIANESVLEKPTSIKTNNDAFLELEQRTFSALETYSNVHRGTGHFSMVSTCLFEKARAVILSHLFLSPQKYNVIFCPTYGALELEKLLREKSYYKITSDDIGLPLGVSALAVRKNFLPKGTPHYTGGNVVKLVSQNSLIWADPSQKFEAGTPSIVNVITFATALLLTKKYGPDCFLKKTFVRTTTKELFYNDKFAGLMGDKLLVELRNSFVGKNFEVPTKTGYQPFSNFDNAASNPTMLPVWGLVKKLYQLPPERYQEVIAESTAIIRNFINADPKVYDIIFTGNTTEATNILANLLHKENDNRTEIKVLTSLLEHHSNELPWRYLQGASIVRINISQQGFINLEELEQILKKHNYDNTTGKNRINLVALSVASNVLGSYNDMKEIGKIAHRYGALFLADAAQLIAHRKIDLEGSNVDFLVFSGHKIYAPFGSGALVAKKSFTGRHQREIMKIKQAGEKNIVGIAAMAKSMELLRRTGMDTIEETEKELSRHLIDFLSKNKEIELFGVIDTESENFANRTGVISFVLKNVPHNLAATELAKNGGIGVRNGCFCAHLLVKHLLKIHPLSAIVADLGILFFPKITGIILPGLVRVSFGLQNNIHEVVRLILCLEKIIKEPRSQNVIYAAKSGNGTPFIPKDETDKEIEKFVAQREYMVYGGI